MARKRKASSAVAPEPEPVIVATMATCPSCGELRDSPDDVACFSCGQPYPDRAAEIEADSVRLAAERMADTRGMPSAPERQEPAAPPAHDATAFELAIGPWLYAAVERVAKGAPTKPTMPVLSNVLLSAGDGRAWVASTDLEVCIVDSAMVTVSGRGSVLVPPKPLLAALKTGSFTRLRVTERHVLYLEGRMTVTIIGSDSADFPTLPDREPGDRIPVDAAGLATALASVEHAISVDETRYHLNGVWLEPGAVPGKLRMVATDGHRLAYVDHPIVGDAPKDREVIVPRVVVGHWLRLLRGWEKAKRAGSVELKIGKNHSVLTVGTCSVIGQHVDGEFPEWRRVLPAQHTARAYIERVEMLAAAKRVKAIFGRVAGKTCGVAVRWAAGAIDLAANHPDVGELVDRVPCHNEGALSVGVNVDYLTQALTAIPGSIVMVTGSDGLSPLVIRGGDVCCVVMPMRI